MRAGKCNHCGKALRVLLAKDVVQLLERARKAGALLAILERPPQNHEWAQSQLGKKDLNDANHKALDEFFNLIGESRREEEEYAFRLAKISMLKESLDAFA